MLVLGSGITQLGVLRGLTSEGARVMLAPAEGDLARRSRWFRPPAGRLADLEPAHLASLARTIGAGMVLMPCSDEWTRAVTALPDEVRANWPAAVGSADSVESLLDKSRLAAVLERLAIPHPRTQPVATERELLQFLTGFERGFLKPAESQAFFGRFGVKALLPKDRGELVRMMAECQEAGFRMLLQEYIPGPPDQHFFLDGMVDRTGRLRACFARRRLRMYPPDFGNSTLMVSIPVAEVASAAASLERLLGHLKYRGIFSAEFKQDARDRTAKLLEVNVRPWWFVEFAARCGVNVCALAVMDALGEPVPTISQYRVGKRCVYPYYDLAALRAARAAGRGGMLAGLISWIGAYQPVFRWSDPGPAVGAVIAMLRARWG